MRRLAALLLPVLMLIFMSAGTVHASGTPDEQYVPPASPNMTNVGVMFLDNLFINMAGYLAADATPEHLDAHSYSTVQQDLCTSYDDAICKGGVAIYYLSHLPKCIDAADLDCIAGIFAIKPDGTRIDGVFARGIPEQVPNPYAGNPALGIPRSGVDGLWTIPGLINGGGTDTYLVIAQEFGSITKPQGTSLSQRIPMQSFGAGIMPVKMISGTYKPAYVGVIPSPNGTKRLAWFAPQGVGTDSCAGISTTECALREAYPADTVFGMSLRLSAEMKGWLHGRIRDPLIDYQTSPSGTSLTIQALPVTVPVVAAWTDRSNLPAVIPGAGADPAPGTAMLGSSSGESMLNLLKVWLPIVKDTAQANPGAWFFGNLGASDMQGVDVCMAGTNTLAGFVSTNSTVYTAGPPQYNSNTESLDYKLVSPHFTNKGDVFKGVYTLAIRSDVARCIYKFSNAPIKATISVTDDSGQSSVAIESMNERDGWIYLSASNFEFSSPTVHVKLTQDAPVIKPTVTPTPSASPTVSSQPSPVATMRPQGKKVTITCTKGKVMKKVASLSPRCPSGYKKR